MTSRQSPAFGPLARRRLILISLGWVLVALAEATAYTVLALAITAHRGPGSVLAAALLALVVTVLVSRGGYLTGARLAGDLFRGIGVAFGRAKLSWFTEQHRALLGDVAARAIPALMSVPAHQLQTFILSGLIPLFLLVGIGLVAGLPTMLLTAALLVLAFAIQLAAQRALSAADRGRSEAEQAGTQATLEFVEHLELLRTAAGPTRAIQRLSNTWHAQEAALARTNRAASRATFISQLASILPLAGVLIAIVATGIDDPTGSLALIMLTARAAAPLDALALAGVSTNELRAMIERYRQVVTAPSLPEPERSMTPQGHEISLSNVSYGPVLQDISADIPQNSTVLVSGPTGAGKSTLLSLLMRFDDPRTGHIRLGGADLAELRYDELAARISYVAQDPVVFDGTLAQNIRLGNPDATEEQILEVGQRAALTAVIEASPLGINQPVGHHGALLSGGERQRVAIARALLKDAPILILDEATSALDAATEEVIAQAVRELPCTTIVVTHRGSEALWKPTQRIVLDQVADRSASEV